MAMQRQGGFVTVEMSKRQMTAWVNFCREQDTNGRPSKYHPKYCDQIIEFFTVKPSRIERIIKKDKWGKEWSRLQIIPNPVPFLIDFARKISVSVPTIHRWVKQYPEFRSAYEHARAMREAMLCTNGLLGIYDSYSWKFVMKNLCGWSEPDKKISNSINFQITLNP